MPPGAGQAARKLREHRIALSAELIEESIKRFEIAAKAEGVAYRAKREEREDPFDFLISRSRNSDLTILRRVLGETALRAIKESEIPLFLSQ